jgi:hypothetical protein
MKSVDAYLDRTFDKKDYNCLHFAKEIWHDLTGVDISERLHGLWHLPTKQIRRHNVRAFVRIQLPTDPCLALMQAPREAPHVGIYIRGRILHITTKGVEFMPVEVAMRGFKNIRYYTC